MGGEHPPPGTPPPVVESARQAADFSDLLQELRVLLQGAQVMTAFLIVLPFNAGFARLQPGVKCVEHHVWTPLPMPPPKRRQAFTLRLREVDARAHDRIKAAGTMTFHMVGCAGDYRQHEPQRRVARAMAAQLHDPDSAEGPGESAAFLYHLGDVVYKDEDAQEGVGDDQHAMYQEQFYAPYADYDRPIFAIAGNHDGKRSADRRTSAIDHFLANFCAKDAKPSSDNEAGRRPAMTQPYPYWRLTTPLAYIIWLYSNNADWGMLDD